MLAGSALVGFAVLLGTLFGRDHRWRPADWSTAFAADCLFA